MPMTNTWDATRARGVLVTMLRRRFGRSLVTRMVLAYCVGGLLLSVALGVLEYSNAEDQASTSAGQQILVTVRNLQEVIHPLLDAEQHDSVSHILHIFAQDPRIVALRLRCKGELNITGGTWPGDLTDSAVWTVDETGVTGFGRLDLDRQTLLALPVHLGGEQGLIEALIDGPYVRQYIARGATERVASQWLMLGILALVGLILLRRWFTGPLTRLVKLAANDAPAEQFEQTGEQIGGELGDLAGALARMLHRLDDVTTELRHREKAFEDLYQHAPSALLSIGPDGKVTNANRRAAHMFGVSKPAALIGRVVLDHVASCDRAMFRQSIDRLEIDRVNGCELQMTFDHGQPIDAAVQFQGVYDNDNKLERVRIALTDISEIKRLMRQVTEHKQLIDLMVNHMSDAILLVSTKDQTVVTANQRVCQMLNASVETLLHRPYDPSELWRPLGMIDDQLFHSRTRYALANHDQTHQEQFEGRSGAYQFRIVPVIDTTGQALAQLWVVQDVTAEARNRRLLQQQDQQLRALQAMGRSLHKVDGVDELLDVSVGHLTEFMGVEAVGVAIRYNVPGKRCRQLFNITGNSIMLPAGAELADAIQCRLMPNVLSQRETSFWSDLSTHGQWAKPIRQAGFESLAATALVAFEHTQGIVWVARRGGETIDRYHLFLLEALAPMLSTALLNAELRERMRVLELTDPVTHLPSYRQFEPLAANVLRQHGPWAVLVVDIDRFSQINDEHGHRAANEALREVAQIISDSCRLSDHAIRYMEDKFLVLCAGASQAPAKGLAERIRQRVDEATIKTSAGAVVDITVSVGLAVSPGDGGDPHDLVALATKRMRAAKQAGRNTVHT